MRHGISRRARAWGQARGVEIERRRFAFCGHETRQLRVILRRDSLPALRERFEQRVVFLEARPQRVVIHHRVVEAALQVPEEIQIEHVAPRVRHSCRWSA